MRCLAKIILFSQINNPSSFILFWKTYYYWMGE
jgi:hypothetical protein